MLEIQGLAPERDDRGHMLIAAQDGFAAVEPILASPPSSDTHGRRAGEDPNTERRTGDWTAIDAPEVDEICGQLAQAVSQWTFLVRQKNALGNSLRAYVRCHRLGWTPSKPGSGVKARAKATGKQLTEAEIAEAESVKIERQVEKILKAARDGTLDDPIIIGLVLASDQAAEVFRKPADRFMREAERMASFLPGAGFVRDTRGFGMASFAKIIGVTGPLHNYSNPAKLWKRLGLGLVNEGDGKPNCRQGKRTDLDLAALHGYSPTRRSISWTAFDAMFKNLSPEWRAIYDRKKAEYLARVEAGETDSRGYKRTRKWADIAARRYTEKRLILRLWQSWMQTARSMTAAKNAHRADMLYRAQHGDIRQEAETELTA